MKKRISLISAILLFALLISQFMIAQVTIGLGEEPEKGTLLQLKEKDNVTDDTKNAYRGLGLPRVTLSKKDQLYPMFLSDPDNPLSNPNNDYDDATKKEAQDKKHTGLIVYNLVEDEEEGLCKGLNQWNGKEWSCFQEKMGNAVGNITNCSSLAVNGAYKNTEPLNSSNYLTVTLNITKIGPYTITGRAGYNGDASIENGYYFITSGMFLTPGEYTIQIPGSGRPLQHTPDSSPGDIITLTMNDKPLTLANNTSCPLYIKVEDSNLRAAYTMNCEQTVVNGVYRLNQPLSASNTITVYITTEDDPLVDGSTCVLKTNEVDGIKFESQPIILTRNQTIPVILSGSGTPTSVDTKRLTITSNSITNVATCYANVPIAFTKKKILGIKGAGGADYYGYGIGYWTGIYASMTNTFGLGGRKMLMAPANFGTESTSTIKTEGYDFVDGGNDPLAGTLQSLINTHEPDIIVLGYSYAPDNNAIDVLIRYMENKGVVVAAMESLSGVERLFNRVLNLPTGTVTAAYRGGPGSIYTFNYMVGDEILNGPFGDVREKYWGEDASTTVVVNNVPPGMVNVYSTGNCYSPNLGAAGQTNGGNMISVCRFKQLNLVWIGDGGFWSRGVNQVEVDSNTICPLYYNNDFTPAVGTFGANSGATSVNIYNSFFYVNVMAWAIKTAQFDGYNTPR
ncbi:MAG: hypothetical protein LBR46_04295 [Prevotella sp.]|jgi:hypothetical protein|nr:hypothetical protein [Prevotella sp.]